MRLSAEAVAAQTGEGTSREYVMGLTHTMKKSTRSNTGGDCVECGFADDTASTVAIADTKNPGPRVVVSRAAFADLLDSVKAGEFDR
jgi:hypothetical protein